MIKRLLIATDAWAPQVNGVVRTLRTTSQILERSGWKVEILHPGLFKSFPCPIYPEIPLSMPRRGFVSEFVRRIAPHHIHIATEGPVGAMVRSFCIRSRIPFTSSFHTLFADYLAKYALVPRGVTWRYLRWFHSRSACIMAPSPSVVEILRTRGFKNVTRWSRGINTGQFAPRARSLTEVERPILLYAGRVSKEKNVEAFLALKVKGTKFVVGDGPQRSRLERLFPTVRFFGYVDDARLAELYAESDIFVFPSRTDTFGNVILEALASGLPVAAYPVPGPKDIIIDERLGALDLDLARAVERARKTGCSDFCVSHAKSYSWDDCTATFASNLVEIR